MLPWLPLAIVAFGLAALFGAGVARPRTQATGAKAAILRWGHAATWVCLGLCFLMTALDIHLAIDAPTVALIGLGSYVVFIITLVDEARRAR